MHAVEYGPYHAELIRVIDGDTIELDLYIYPQIIVRAIVRVFGINTPEKRTTIKCEKAEGIKATKLTTDFLSRKNKTIEVMNPQFGKYAGRIVASVYVDGESLAEYLMQKGAARAYYGEKRESWCND